MSAETRIDRARARLARTQRLAAAPPVTVIGAGFVDVVVAVDRIPERGGDLHAQPRRIVAGGCGLNVARALVRLGVAVAPGIPIGDGPWADIVREELDRLGLHSRLTVGTGDNGWCLAMVEPDGERTFVTVAGIEQQLSPSLLRRLDPTPGGLLYVSGYEFLCGGGAIVLDWLEHTPRQRMLLDPGPRVGELTPELLNRLGAVGAIVTVNRDETVRLCGSGHPRAIASFADTWALTIVARVGAQGAWLCVPGQQPQHAPTRPATAVDTIGAGDAHAAGMLAAMVSGWPLFDAVWLGNQVATTSVTRPGSDGVPGFDQVKRLVASGPTG